MNAQPECFCLEEMLGADGGGLWNRDAAEFKSTPRGNAHAANFERHPETACQFLLNLCLCALGLHIQVHANQENCAQRDQCPQSNQYQPAQFSHPEMLRSPSLKQTSKPLIPLSRE